ncbi:MAG: PHP domain-containing protein [Eubacteriaceae bacterium]|nr:PHP domain-containing protein [Eubacteriaceae bacterium]
MDTAVKADLHTHTTFSDGDSSIEEIINAAIAKGIDAVAITDHDTVSHFGKVPERAAVRVLKGIEICAVHPETSTRTHILGYNMPNPEIAAEVCLPYLIARNENSMRQAGILIELGYSIDIGKLSRAEGKYLYKQHIMDWLVSTGQADSYFGDDYKAIFKNAGPCDFDIEYCDCFTAINAIKASGGLAVLAHAGQQQSFWLVRELARAGLDGIELNHQSHSDLDKLKIASLAKRYSLFMTGGSDFHGRYEQHGYGVGDILSHESGVEALLSR